MALFKCKMCGGGLEINNETVITCEYCGTKQTLPRLDDDRRINLYDRANHFRRNNEFDKAAGIYEQILNEDPTDAEAYWSLVLCRYGIEYVEDPTTHKRLPTVNRAQFTSVFDDHNYTSALEYADPEQRKIYEAEAKGINQIQKGILIISQKEDPFDVFICYKETDNNGRRTPDSVLANELYHQLTQEGFRVFFSRITLEDKLGSAYEPYIFAALNSAKVMVVLGTKPEYFKAVWVQNEWSRYLALVKASKGQKVLIPAYRDMDPYDLPEEFSHLQAQDMSKLGFMQDLIRGIKKLAPVDGTKATAPRQTVAAGGPVNTAPLLQRAFIFLEDGNWAAADEYCEKVLDQEPQNAGAYLGKLMAQLTIKKKEALKDCPQPFDDNNNYQKILRFGDEQLVAELNSYVNQINNRNENIRLEGIYTNAKRKMEAATEEAYLEAAQLFETISQYKDAAALIEECHQKAETARKDALYNEACVLMSTGPGFRSDFSTTHLEKAISHFQSLNNWKESKENIRYCQEKIEQLKAEEEADRFARHQQARHERLAAAQQKKFLAITVIIATAILASILLLVGIIIPAAKYNQAVSLIESGDYFGALSKFQQLKNYRDSQEQIDALWSRITLRETISAGVEHTVVLMQDGTVVAVGSNDEGQCNVSAWTDIVAISAGYDHTVGLKADGTVVATESSIGRLHKVEHWTDIVAISAGYAHTVGLRSDGTVMRTGTNTHGQCNVSQWNNIIEISAGAIHTVALKDNGTVVATGDNTYGQCDVSNWRNIIAVSAGVFCTVGLKADGTVVIAGYNVGNVSNWTNIVAISAESNHIVGLKSNGTVVATGDNEVGQCDVSNWRDIVAISAGSAYTVGLKSNGTVVAVGSNYKGQCKVSDWEDIKLP